MTFTLPDLPYAHAVTTAHSRNREDLERQGVIFCDMDTALRETVRHNAIVAHVADDDFLIADTFMASFSRLFGVDQKILEYQLTGAIVVDQLDEAVALGRRVLGVRPHIEVEARAVLQEHIR